MKLPVYLDYNATTPVDPVVLERMLPFFREHFGNPSSTGHAYGWAAEEAVTQAREQVAGLLGATPEEIVFTSGATEAINMAVKGVAEAYARKGRHVVTVQTEHAAVLGACRALERRGFRVTYLPVAPDGRVAPDDVAAALTEETILVAVMWANNETGVLQPVEALGEVVRAHGALFLCDATQAVGKVPVTVEHVDLLACSAHKFYGPKGVGALYVRQGRPPVRLAPLLDGGSQEGGRRAGTLNVPGIVGMG
ncbi:MAG: cysteine desulfurase, partial [Bacteroidetes bacterium]